MNIEHEYYDATEMYEPFEGICLVDTFDLASEDRPQQLGLDFMAENFARVENQQKQNITVIMGNPPYNMGQLNENDNNKNRKYPKLDRRVRETYAKDSTATLKSSLYDAYVKAIRWASDRIDKSGVVAFVTNNSFLDSLAFDGMRKHLAEDFDTLYILDLGGNARRDESVSDSSVFGIQVGVCINFFIKRSGDDRPEPRIFYFRTDDLWTRRQKFDFLDERQHLGNILWEPIEPDNRHTWLRMGLRADFLTFMPLGSKLAKKEKGEVSDVIFHQFSTGVLTGRDAWAYNFNRIDLAKKMKYMIETYNDQVFRWKRKNNRNTSVDEFVVSDDTKISWSETLKGHLKGGRLADFTANDIRHSFFRPFTMTYLYFNQNDERSRFRLPVYLSYSQF